MSIVEENYKRDVHDKLTTTIHDGTVEDLKRFLFNNQVQINFADGNAWTGSALIYALHSADISKLELVIQAGAKFDNKTKFEEKYGADILKCWGKKYSLEFVAYVHDVVKRNSK